MTISLPKIKFKFSLNRILAAILVLVAILELFFLYRALFAPVEITSDPAEDGPPQTTVNFDLEQYERLKNLIETKKSFALPEYTLTATTTGRDNPFADY